MSTLIDDGVLAFPRTLADRTLAEGMTLRDWFAGHFICGIAINADDEEIETWRHKNVAKWAYAQADAMLAVRKGGRA